MSKASGATLTLCFLFIFFLSGASGQTPPFTAKFPTPPVVKNWQPPSLPLDLRLLLDRGHKTLVPPDLWCPSGPDFDNWLATRKAPVDPARKTESREENKSATITYRDGIILIEDDGLVLRNDNIFDLPMETLEFVPSGPGYTVSMIPSAYEPDIGAPLFTDATSWMGINVGLSSFTFPFGGEDRSNFWVTSAIALTFEQPDPPVSERFCMSGCYHRKMQVLLDRTPRIAPLQHGTSLYGWNAYFREDGNRAIVTWRASTAGLEIDAQAVLFADGRIHLNYAAVQGVTWGVAAVLNGSDAWWTNLSPAGMAVDPDGDVAIPGPDGPSMDFLGARADQVSGSEILQFELMLVSFLPGLTEEDIYFYITLKDDAADPEPFQTLYFVWSNGSWRYRNSDVENLGTRLRFYLDKSELLLTDNEFFMEIYSFRYAPSYELGDYMTLDVNIPLPASPVMLDFSEELPATVDSGLIFEAFTLPELLPFAVREAVQKELGDVDLDGMAIWQNLDTDIIFFAGGYHAGGNAGADGIGRGSSADPLSPSLLHVNNIYRINTISWLVTLLNHEFGHRWLYFFNIDEGGTIYHALNPDGAHPAGWVHTPGAAQVVLPDDFSCMGGSTWTDNGNGTFTSVDYTSGLYLGFSWAELYLMGLADPSEVSDWFYLQNTNPPVTNAYWAPSAITVSGTRVPVTIDQILAAEGPRNPAYPMTQSDFIVPMVLVVRPGEYTQEEVDFTAELCDYWYPYFEYATADRGHMRCTMFPPDVTIVTPAADPVIQVGEALDFSGVASDPDGDSVELHWDFSGVSPGTNGPGPHQVTFPIEGVFTVRLEGVDDTGMRDPTPDVVTVTVECSVSVPQDEVKPLKVARESSSLRFVWPDLTTGPDDYVVLSASLPTEIYLPADAAPSGSPGLLLSNPPENTFYKVAARYDPGCLGP